MNLIYELVGILGFAANVWANILIARKTESGWIVRLVANGLWLAYGIAIISIANIASSVVFTGINIYGLRRWRRERLEDRRRRSEIDYALELLDHYAKRYRGKVKNRYVYVSLNELETIRRSIELGTGRRDLQTTKGKRS